MAKRLAAGELTLSLAFDEAHKSGSLSQLAHALSPGARRGDPARFAHRCYRAPGRSVSFPGAGAGHAALGLVLIERDAPGVTIADEVDLTTDATVARLTLPHCRIPNEQLLGYEYEAGAIIAAEQLRIAARSLGIGMRCLAASIEHARNRVTFGRRLAERQAIQWMLADLSIEIRTTARGSPWKRPGAPIMICLISTRRRWRKNAPRKMAFQAADTAIQIHGGYGVCKEFPFEGFYREARMMRLLYGREEEMNRAAGEKFLRQ